MFSFMILISWALALANAQSTTGSAVSPLSTPDYATGSSVTATSAGPLVTRVVDIDAGRNGLFFTPNTVTANPQDIINFHFWPGNHSVAESSYAAPCVPLAGGVGNTPIFSGFMAVEGTGEGPNMFSMSVTNSDPVWLYCAQTAGGDHCQNGMVMGINPLSSQDVGSYVEAAKGTTSVSPAKLYGGIIGPNQAEANASSGGSVGVSGTASASASASTSTHKSCGVQKKFVEGVWAVVGAVAGLWLFD